VTNLLELKGISKTFPGVKALSDVDLDLRPGEVLGLCGENGAGKSTLMKVLTGIHKSDPGGEIWLQGEQVDIQSPEHARDLGLSIIHQELNIVPDLTVAQNLYLGRQESSKWMYVDDRKLVRDARELFERLNMDIDPTARCRDLPVARLRWTFFLLVSAAVVAALQTVGAILVIALLITPGATAFLLCRSFGKVLVTAFIIGVSTAVIGTYASYFLDSITGAVIVVLQGGLFLAVFTVRRLQHLAHLRHEPHP